MKVFSIVDNKAQETSLRKKGKKAVRGGRKKPAPKPPRENVTADQIRAKVKAFSDKNKLWNRRRELAQDFWID